LGTGNGVPAKAGNSAKNTLKQNLQLLKEEHETDNETSEQEIANKGQGNMVHYTTQGLNTNSQSNHLPSNLPKNQNFKEQDPKKLFSKKYKEIGRENMSSSTKNTLTNVTTEQQSKMTGKPEFRKEPSFSAKYGGLRSTGSNKHSHHSSASLQKPKRQSNSPGTKSRSPQLNSEGGGSFWFVNKSHYKTISKDSGSMKLPDSAFNLANVAYAPSTVENSKRCGEKPGKSTNLMSGGLYEKAREKILMTKKRKH
jgi:hypothetical protein